MGEEPWRIEKVGGEVPSLGCLTKKGRVERGATALVEAEEELEAGDASRSVRA